MKPAITMICVAMLTLVTGSVQADTRTKINDDTTTVFMGAAYDRCVNGSSDTQKRIFCACAAISTTGNLVQVISKYKLYYEDEILSHMGEVSLTKSQALSCINRSRS